MPCCEVACNYDDGMIHAQVASAVPSSGEDYAGEWGQFDLADLVE